MRCRFVKRFTISIVLLCFGGLWFFTKYAADIGGSYGSTIKLFNSRRFFEDLMNINTTEEKKISTVTETEWMLDVLKKNLSKYETIETLLTEIDKRIPKEYREEELTANSFTVHSSPPGHSSNIPTAETPTEPVKPNLYIHHKRNRTKRKPPNTLFPGFMNVHIWEAWCGKTVEDLRRNKHFPLYPDARATTDELFVKQRALNYGQRIFGYLHPPKTGYFTFCLSSDDNSEFWLSNSSSPNDLRKLAWVGNVTNPENTPLAQFKRFRGQISSPVYLFKGGKYFMEILHKQAGFTEHVLVAWKGPGIPRTKRIISDYISAYIDEDELSEDVNLLAEYVPETKASFPTHLHGSFEANYLFRKNVSKFGIDDRRDHFHLTPSINESELAGLLPKCSYRPSYLVDFDVNRYEGVYLIHDTAVYPNDQTELTHMIPSTSCENRLVDSHMNLIRPTTPSLDDDNDEAEITEKPASFTISPKFSILLSKLKNRFRDFGSYMKSNNGAFGKKRIARGKIGYVRKFNNGRKSRRKVKATGVTTLVTRKSAADTNDVSHDIEENSEVSHENTVQANAKKNKKNKKYYAANKKNDKQNIKLMVLKRQADSNKLILSPEEDETSYEDDSLKVDLDSVNKGPLGFEAELAGGNLLAASRKTTFKAATKPSEYQTKLKGRRLLAASEKRRVKYAFETDNEGLPASWNGNKRARPVFVPITGVENINKPLPKTSASIPRTVTTSEGQDDEDSFQVKSYYKRLNITSNRDVIRYFKIYRYAFYDMIQEIPRVHTWKFKFSLSQCRSDGNLLLNSKVANSVVNTYMGLLKAKYADKYTLKKIVNVEENHDVINGDRYLIELDLKVKGHGEKSFRLSRYVYQKLGSLRLCEPLGFQWNPHADVHVIVPVKNQGRWVQHFIDNMEKIYLETLDPHLSVIIVDFNSSDIDIEASLRKSKLKRYQLIKMDGMFQRALGIQAGADAVKNPKDIIFTCDLHLEIPSSLIYSIRKHCVQGKMAFAPIVVRLDCGYKPENPYGLWEIQGYGLFAICKSDFDKAGGMNTKEFKTKWGGEDWEMLDRILSSGIEVERLRIPKFYHYFHSKKRMWNHQKS